MSEIKALEDMRNTVKTIAADCDEGWILGCLDAIEAEIAERFMELPVDADGVPIRPDDLMSCTAFDTNDFDGKEHAMAVGNGFWVDKDGYTHIPSETRHYHAPSIEDVLREFAYKVCDINVADSEIERFADKLREVLGNE